MKPSEDQILLPFAEKEYVDVKRTARILGASPTTVFRLAATRGPDGRFLISLIDYRRQARKRVLYSSIVHFCDDLRRKYHIEDRRPALSHPMFRHKDVDLLPFPLTDTIGTAEVLRALGYINNKIVPCLIEEGAFEAYQLFSEAQWRISRRSFMSYLCRVGLRVSTGERQLSGSRLG